MFDPCSIRGNSLSSYNLPVTINITSFPFDLFGSSGSRAGPELLFDEIREILADNRREQVKTRAAAYRHCVKLHEVTFETTRDYNDWRRRGRQAVRKAWHQDQSLMWLSGNHLGVLSLYDELAGTDTLVVQLDAHLDIHHFSTCTQELSHGNFLMHTGGKLPAIWNIGHRDLLLPEEHIRKFYRTAISATDFLADEAAVLRRLKQAAARAKRVFIDIDCDVLDPVHFPAVAEPVPFGLSPHQLLRIVNAVWSKRVIGLALSEFHPAHDDRDRCLATLVWFIEYLLLALTEKETK
jgi:arginase family enzyme